MTRIDAMTAASNPARRERWRAIDVWRMTIMVLFRYCITAIACITMLAGVVSAQTPAAAAKPAPAASADKATVLNLNTATVAELEHLPGIGPKVAARIVDYRTKKGPFRKTEEIMESSR